MVPKAVPLATYIEELRHVVVVAMQNFDIWWVYKQRQDRARYIGVLNAYPSFFQTSLHAHFVALIVALYRVYETRSDTINLAELMKRVGRETTISPRKLSGINRRIATAGKLWVKVCILRNEAFGHRANSRSVSDVFKKAGVTPNELRGLIYSTRDIVNAISCELDGSRHAFILRATADTRRMLKDLKELKALRFNTPVNRTSGKRGASPRTPSRGRLLP